ncbi:transposase [Streptomyces sp. NPDC002306]
MVAEVRLDCDTEWKAMRAVASKLGIGTAESVRQWVRRDQIDRGTGPGVTAEESVQVKALKREVAELKTANEILKDAARFFAAEPDRPHLRSYRSSTSTGTASVVSSRSVAC